MCDLFVLESCTALSNILSSSSDSVKDMILSFLVFIYDLDDMHSSTRSLMYLSGQFCDESVTDFTLRHNIDGDFIVPIYDEKRDVTDNVNREEHNNPYRSNVSDQERSTCVHTQYDLFHCLFHALLYNAVQ